MTSKEALKIIKEIPLDEYEEYKNVGYFYERQIEILEQLVERETPMKVNKSVEWNYKCSNCKEYINRDYGENKYCGNCGQRLDWSD